jgi:hypothetical protein
VLCGRKERVAANVSVEISATTTEIVRLGSGHIN